MEHTIQSLNSLCISVLDARYKIFLLQFSWELHKLFHVLKVDTHKGNTSCSFIFFSTIRCTWAMVGTFCINKSVKRIEQLARRRIESRRQFQKEIGNLKILGYWELSSDCLLHRIGINSLKYQHNFVIQIMTIEWHELISM